PRRPRRGVLCAPPDLRPAWLPLFRIRPSCFYPRLFGRHFGCRRGVHYHDRRTLGATASPAPALHFFRSCRIRRCRHVALSTARRDACARAFERRHCVVAATMNEGSVLAQIASRFALLSLLSFGGVNVVLPDAHRFVVDTQHWLTDQQFADFFA